MKFHKNYYFRKLINKMKFKAYILFLLLFIPVFLTAKGEPQKDTIRSLAINTKITKLQLVKIIDSLLDLDNIDIEQVELISYYSSIINSIDKSTTITHCNNIPATNFYDDFDESTVFQVTAPNEFPETQVITIQSDSLGYYAHPRVGQINSKFGWRDGRMHKGIDINLHRGDAVVAAFDGMVRIANVKGAYGKVIIIRHYNGLETVYAHLSKIKVKQGQVVLAGQVIGQGGSTGRSSGPHLHFEVRFKGQALNPAAIISFTEHKLLHDSIVIKRSKYGICAYPSNATLHTVEKGDTWYEIAKRYGHTVKELCILNNTDKRYYLKPGQKLRVN